MSTALLVLLALGWPVAGLAGFVAWRFFRKAAVYDGIFQTLNDDIVVNLQHFGKMATSPLLSNEPEISEAHRKMMIMGQRLNEILNQMEEATGLRLRPPPRPPRPKTV